MRDVNGNLIGADLIKPKVNSAGGGYVIGISQSGDGKTTAVNTDVYNAYICCPDIFGDSVWRPLLTADSLQPSEYDPRPDNGNLTNDAGGFAVAVAPSNYRRLWVGCNAFVYRVDIGLDGTITATRTSRAAKRQLSNTGDQRYWNDKFAGHPTDPDTALFGTTNDGVTYTTDAGATHVAVNGSIPACATHGNAETPYLVAFDPQDGDICYIFAQGTGLYRSTAGVSGTFTAVSGGPEFCSHLLVDADGVVWACDPTGVAGSNLSKYDGSGWAVVSTPATPLLTVAVNPADTDHIVCAGPSGATIQSLTGGASWINNDVWGAIWPAPVGQYANALDDTPWLEGSSFFSSKLLFDHAVPNKLWRPTGVGVLTSTPPATWSRWDWYSQTQGIKELIANGGLSVPGTPWDLLGCWDKPIWLTENPDSAEGSYRKPPSPEAINHAWQFDYAADDPDYVIVTVSDRHGTDRSGQSENGGRDWTSLFDDGVWPLGQGGGGGSCAMNERGNIIMVPGNNRRAIYKKNGVWNYLPIDPNIGGNGNWINANYNLRNLVAADKTRPGVFAIIMNGDNQGANVQGLHVSLDGGDSWTRNVAGRLDSTGDAADYWHCQLAYIPGKSGELLYTTGKNFSSRLLHFTGDGLTTAKIDVGAAWGITQVRRFGFGAKCFPEQDYPTIYFIGVCDGLSGVYRSIDFFATKPVLLSRFPLGSIDRAFTVVPSRNRFGRVYIGFANSDWCYAQYAKRMVGVAAPAEAG
ncbi:MAG: hypothetical protein CVT74_07445 [Alphaproteobacteria bacterium HGW-Alphaproteobacteria-13]|nr:MAG: hypothetical protein CVT74_07445 [Alphaproteobacteria bacterium HGW-Alphaproteobacteria-13]